MGRRRAPDSDEAGRRGGRGRYRGGRGWHHGYGERAPPGEHRSGRYRNRGNGEGRGRSRYNRGEEHERYGSTYGSNYVGRGRHYAEEQKGGDRGLLDTAIRSRNFDYNVSNPGKAIRLVTAMINHTEPSKLLLDLLDSNNRGLQLITGIIEQCSESNMSTILIPLVSLFLGEAYSKPIQQTLRDTLLIAIFETPLLLEVLLPYIRSCSNPEEASPLCEWVLVLLQASSEMIRNVKLKELAVALHSRHITGSSKIYHVLCASDADHERVAAIREQVLSQAARALTEAEKRPPGGRHDNDFRQFREIVVVPTPQELRCTERPYLPLANGTNRFIMDDDQQHCLDTTFRLLRHEAIQPIKEALKDSATPYGSTAGRTFRVYPGCRLHGIDLSANSRPSVVIQFNTPQELIITPQLSNNEVKEFWTTRSMLTHSSLVCFRRNGEPFSLGTIAAVQMDWLMCDNDAPCVGVAFENSDGLENFMHVMLTETARNRTRLWNEVVVLDMVVLSTGFFASVNILKSLQRMMQIPLEEELLPLPLRALTGTHNTVVPPEHIPSYIPEDGIIDLAVSEHLTIRNLPLLDAEVFIQEVVDRSTLDISQATALHHALTRRVALIQGPPGTGKSFLGTLLANAILKMKREVKILCLCFSNHALDQFLEGLVDYGVTRIVRVGKRSKSTKLEPYALDALVSRDHSLLSQDVRRLFYQCREACDEIREEMPNVQRFLAMNRHVEKLSWSLVEHYLERVDAVDPFIVPELEDGFIYANKDMNKPDYLWKQWIHGKQAPTCATTSPIWILSHSQRIVQAYEWLDSYFQEELEKILRNFQDYSLSYARLQKNKLESKRQVLQNVRVIGATTSGATNMKTLIESSGAEVVIVEEAGEVLEAHILTSITSSVKHLILIGDHKQLRPKVQTYELQVVSGRGYNLDKSMFERLVRDGGLHPSVLSVQRRMRPQISRLIRGTYPDLTDYEGVRDYPDVRGISKNVIFLNHSSPEENREQGRSLKNFYEMDLCVSIARLLLQNGYKPRQLVILTPYLGQMLSLQRKVRSEMHDIQTLISDIDKRDLVKYGILEQDELSEFSVSEDDDDSREGESKNEKAAKAAARLAEADQWLRIATVDNFQGEESDIVIISCVRSNSDGNIGFLKEPERVNVLLSRAKHGMIIIGNADTLRQSQKGQAHWEPVLHMLEVDGCLLDHIPSYCQLHPSDTVELRTPIDFKTLRPNGGCTLPCSFRMSCGHACPQRCHSVDPRHEHIRCLKPCKRFPPQCPQRHQCPKLCWQDCGPCTTMVHDVVLACGHSKSAKCNDVSDEARRSKILCQVLDVPVVMPECGHEVSIACTMATGPQDKWVCPKPCLQTLECDHPCSGKCGTCRKQGYHASCGYTCARVLMCGHSCDLSCHVKCPPCEKKCAKRCFHSKCSLPCKDQCASCIEPCVWTCDHQGECTLPCGAPCVRLPCDQRCQKPLPCGHQCPGVCGEICPSADYCQVCGKKGNELVDIIGGADYAQVDVNVDPVCVLPCGHFYCISTLDGLMQLDQYYEREGGDVGTGTGQWVRHLPVSEAEASGPKCCPDCRAVIFGLQRYGRPIQHRELQFLERKFIFLTKEKLMRLVSRSNDLSVDECAENIYKLYYQVFEDGPTVQVYEAAGGSSQVEVPKPPSSSMLEVAASFGRIITGEGIGWLKKNPKKCLLLLQSAREVAVKGTYFSRFADITLHIVRAEILSTSKRTQSKVLHLKSMLNEVINHSSLVVTNSHRDEARRLFPMIDGITAEEIQSIKDAMEAAHEYGFGTSWNMHWHECPNGHPYFIGECGGAMQTSSCPECGAMIGGANHTLAVNNRLAELTIR